MPKPEPARRGRGHLVISIISADKGPVTLGGIHATLSRPLEKGPAQTTMRLLTHNSLRNNAADAKGKGFPLRITASEIRVDNTDPSRAGQVSDQQIDFVRGLIPSLDWPALVTAAKEMGVPTLPPTLTKELVEDTDFLKALHHVLFHVHLVNGTLTCPVTGRQFQVENEIPNMLLEEDECEAVRY